MKKVFKNTQDYRQYFEQLIEQERLAEKEFHLTEIKRLSGRDRENRGRAILHLNAKFLGAYLDFKIYRFGRDNMPEHQIKVGDIVLISMGNPLRFSIEGTVSAVGNKFIDVMTTSNLFKADEYRLDLFVNDVTYKRMLYALYSLENSEFPIDILLGQRAPEIKTVEVTSDKLNPSQNQALKRALESELFIVHGPPGTGKTTTLAEIIRKSLGKRILVTADSNVAVDNLVEYFTDRNIVRIGHPAKIDDRLMQFSLDERIRQHSKYKKVEKISREIEALKRQQEERYTKPVPSKRRGFTDEQILKMAERHKSGRGLSANTIIKMAGWLRTQKKINSLVQKRDKLVKQIADQILTEAEIIFATNSGAGSEYLEDFVFDIVFIDEGAQATEPSALIPLIKAKRAVFAGDHKQLPPTLLSQKAQKKLQYTMFERFADLYPEAVSLLKVQYRMNEVICKFSSCKFYNCEVESHSSVKNIVLSDLIPVDETVAGDVPIVFFNTQGKWREKQKADSPSKYNPQEAVFVIKLVEQLLDLGLNPEAIGVITPYKDHEEFIKRRLKQVEVKSVDGFQGREKEVIILSLVRSNEEAQVGFLKDYRRINVAITRAKRKLMIVGDITTLQSDALLRDLIHYIEQNGKIVDIA